jgi:hypothetical protein
LKSNLRVSQRKLTSNYKDKGKNQVRIIKNKEYNKTKELFKQKKLTWIQTEYQINKIKILNEIYHNLLTIKLLFHN